MTIGVLFEPTEEQRRTVKALSGYGVPQEGIAVHIGIDAKTLRKHFRDELDRNRLPVGGRQQRAPFQKVLQVQMRPLIVFWKNPEG